MATNLSSRTSQLQALQNQFAPFNADAAKQAEAARNLQIQQAVAAASPTTASTVAAPVRDLGAQVVAAGMQARTDRLAQTQQGLANVGKLGLQEQSRQFDAQGAKEKLAEQRTASDLEARLGRLDRTLKDRLVDAQMQFERDATGRTLLNERQLQDYAAIVARNEEDLKSAQQIAEQAWTRKLQLMQQASRQLEQSLQQELKKGETEKNNKLLEELTREKQALDSQIAEDTNKAKNRMAQFQAAGTVVGSGIGAVVGSIFPGIGTAAGAVVGSAIGSGLGTAAASIDTSKIFA